MELSGKFHFVSFGVVFEYPLVGSVGHKIKEMDSRRFNRAEQF